MPDVLDPTPGFAGAGGLGLSLLLAVPGRGPAPFSLPLLLPHPATPGPSPGPHELSLATGSGFDQPPEKTAEAGQEHGLGRGGSLELSFFFCPLHFNVLLWKMLSLYKHRETRRVNPHVPTVHLNCYQLRANPPLPIIQTKSQPSFHHKYIKIKVFPTTVSTVIRQRSSLCFISSNTHPTFTFSVVKHVYFFLTLFESISKFGPHIVIG